MSYDDPALLALVGPVMKGAWSVPPALATHLKNAGRPVPPPVLGYLLIDTGAGKLAIAEDAATELGLNPVAIGKSYGAHGLQNNNIFEAQLTVGFVDSDSNVLRRVETVARCSGIPDLGKHWRVGAFKSKEDYPVRLIGLLGRDFLVHATFIYHGSKGVIEVIIDPPTFRPPQVPNL